MTRKLFFTITSIAVLVYGLVALLIPVQFIQIYASKLDSVGAFICRYWGSAFLGLAVIFWYARLGEAFQLIKGILIGGLVATGIGFLVALADAIWGDHNVMIWTSVILYAAFAIGFLYYLLKKEK